MKLGLLVVLAVAVLVPSLSESRIISKCELKEKLGEAIEVHLPWRLQRFKERIVKIVVCKLMRLSNLNTGLVKVHGKRRTTTARPTTTRPTTIRPTTTEATTTRPTITRPTTPEATTTRPTTTRPTTTEAATTTTTTEATTTRPTTTEAATTTTTTETTTRPTTTEAATTTTTTETTTTRPTTTEATTTTETTAPESGASTLEPNRTAAELGKRRKKREADSDESENSTELENSLEEILNQEENLFDEEEMEEDDNRTDSDEESGEDGEDEQDSEESGKRKKRFVGRWKPKRKRTWSLGYYGLFQLSDSYFCDSGYRWSQNRCQTSCSAFTDDDITDDIDCFVRTGYWWHVLKSRAFRSCHYRVYRRFRQCN